MIEIEELTFKYVGRRQPTIRDLSLSIPDGQSVLVLGPSGCGKSTLALCLNGAVPHAIEGDLCGTVRVDGQDTRRASLADLAQRVGIVFQDPESQFCMLSVEDEIAFGLENLAVPRQQMDQRIDEVLATVGLANRRRDRIERLSGGQKQRLALACVLAQQPDVIVLDEPTAQLDPGGAADLLALLAEIRATGKHTMIVVEHRLDEVMPLIDRAIVLSAEGALVADGPPREIIHRHGDWLAEAGVWTPQVSEIARHLEHEGLRLYPFPLTVAEAADALRPHLGAVRAMKWAPTSESPVGAQSSAPDHSCAPDHSSAPDQTISRDRSEVVLDVQHLTFAYPRAARPVLRDLTFSVRSGELVAVVGANGTGKSTLARLIAGIVQPPSGAIRVAGQDVASTSPAGLASAVGYVFQYPEHQFVAETALDDVAYGPRRSGRPEAEVVDLASAMLDDFGLLKLAKAHPFTLSHGEQRRLSVASMLVLGQRLLLLDEPTFGQDQRNATMLVDKLEALANSGRAIVVISHDMRLVAERARRVLVLVDGALAFDGPPTELFADAALLARAHLALPPLWDLSRRIGLPKPIAASSRIVRSTPPASAVAAPATASGRAP